MQFEEGSDTQCPRRNHSSLIVNSKTRLSTIKRQFPPAFTSSTTTTSCWNSGIDHFSFIFQCYSCLNKNTLFAFFSLLLKVFQIFAWLFIVWELSSLIWKNELSICPKMKLLESSRFEVINSALFVQTGDSRIVGRYFFLNFDFQFETLILDFVNLHVIVKVILLLFVVMQKLLLWFWVGGISHSSQ